MKKFFKEVGLISLIIYASVFFFVSCKNELQDYKGAGYVDQQITLGTPDVRGKTYPGVNYIYWDRVANAVNGYTLSIYEDGVLTNDKPITLAANQTYYVDKNVRYNVSKTYKVNAIGDSAGRYVIYTESNTGSITLTPIVPPTDTPVLELAKYERGYREGSEYQLSQTDTEFMLSADTIKVAKNEAQGTFTVTFPVKAYLKYTVYADYGNTFDITGIHEYTVGTYQDMAVNNKTATVKGVATVSGDYNIYVKASACNAKYFNSSDDIKAEEGLSYSKLALSSTYTATNISYTYDDESTVTIFWQPATLADGKYAKASQYKIYKAATGLTNYELVDSEITLKEKISATAPTYKITDETDGESYKYLFVLTDGINYSSVCTDATVSYGDADIEDSEITIAWKDIDNDGAYNDAYVLVTLADLDKTLTAVTYGVAGDKDDAYEIAVAGAEEQTVSINGTYKVYAFTIENAAEKTGDVLAVRATISEAYKNDNYISKSSTYTKPDADAFGLYEDSINIIEANEDGLFNDVSFAITATNPKTSLKVTYATADDKETAVKLLDSGKAKTVGSSVTGYTYYEFTPAKYTVLKDLALDKFVAIRVTASQANKADRIADYVSSTKTNDATNTTAAPTATSIALKALDEDRIANDLYATIEVYNNQSISKLCYTTATTEEYDPTATEVSTILADRLDSSNSVDVKTSIKEKYHTDEKIIYEVTVKDLDIGNYVALGYVISQNGFLDKTGSLVTDSPVSDVVVPVVSTAAPVLSQSALYFDACSSDANYNDISDYISISIDVDQKIKSIRYAYAETKAKVDELLRTESTAAKTCATPEIPEDYYLETSITGTTATLTKVYDLSIRIDDVPDGNMVGLKIVVSEPGCEDNAATIYTTAKNYGFTNPFTGTTDTISVSTTAAQKPVQNALLTVDDGKNYEYVHVIVKDCFYNDDLYNYTYKLERTYEDWYNEPDAVWETIEDGISLSQYYDYTYSEYYYAFDKWYKDIPVGTYVYRLTKTRKVSASVTGEAETAVTDAGVNVVYNVELGELGFSDYSAENLTLSLAEYIDPRYDNIDKYDYSFSYYVVYEDDWGNTNYGTTQTLEGWSWTKEYDNDGNETGYYLLTNAVINRIQNTGIYQNATVNVSAQKVRKIATDEYGIETTSLFLNWGISATISPDSEIGLEEPYESLSGGTTYIHVEVSDGEYDSYTWYLDGQPISLALHIINGDYVELDKQYLSTGTHEIVVVATVGDILYSATVTYEKQ